MALASQIILLLISDCAITSSMENLREILTGGQSFSWREEDDGVFAAALNGRVYRIKSLDDCYSDSFLRAYFDLDYDYEKARADIKSKDPVLKAAVESVGEIRILKQDEWTAMISFILSQNNNIKRITGLYNRISELYGHEIEKGFYSFPTAEDMKMATYDELRSIGTGFRAPFILDAIEKSSIIDEVKNLSFDDAMERLQSIKGIGPKVASCILIFGYGRREGFPIDVWMKKILSKYYSGVSTDYFAPYQALSQQYLFSYARMLGSSL